MCGVKLYLLKTSQRGVRRANKKGDEGIMVSILGCVARVWRLLEETIASIGSLFFFSKVPYCAVTLCGGYRYKASVIYLCERIRKEPVQDLVLQY